MSDSKKLILALATIAVTLVSVIMNVACICLAAATLLYWAQEFFNVPIFDTVPRNRSVEESALIIFGGIIAFFVLSPLADAFSARVALPLAERLKKDAL